MYDRDHLKEALQGQQLWTRSGHNELVLDVSSITPLQLPGSILAFFHEGDVSLVRPFHEAFMRSFGLEEWECPLLAFKRDGGPGEVFSLSS